MRTAADVDQMRPPMAAEIESSEAHRALVDLSRGKTGKISPEWLASEALRVTVGADFPVQRAALEALLRRLASVHSDRLKVKRLRPGPLGLYAIVGGRALRPYRTLVASLDRFRGSCDCADYCKGSLGLCKHLLAVVEDLARRGVLGRPVPMAVTEARSASARLIWDPVRPMRGQGDWLERVQLENAGCKPDGVELPASGLGRWLTAGGRPRPSARSAPARRLELCRELRRFLRAERSSHRGTGSDPALWPLLDAEIDALERAASGSTLAGDLLRDLKDLKLQLYPYQLEGVRRFLTTGRLLLADDMGLGKTAQAIASCHLLFRAGRVKRGLVVTPASLKPQWLREWNLFSDVPIELVEGGPAERARIYHRTRSGFLLVNYEQALRDLSLMQRFAPDVVVLDEAQRIKNWAAKTAVQIKTLTPKFRLVLTGTPMENRLDELASLVEWVSEHAIEPKWRLAPWHSTAADGGREIVGARNLDTLRLRLGGCLLRRLRQDVLAQLPPRTDTEVLVPLTQEQQEAHDELNEPIARVASQARRRPLTQAEFLRLMSLFTCQRIISNGLAQRDFEEVWPSLVGARFPTEALLRSLGSPKLLELRELLRSVAVTQGRKVVVFSQWRRMLRLAQWATADVLAEGAARSVFFTGDEGQRRRTQNLVDFHDDPATRVLFASDAGGVGLNLQRAANCCINLELPWNPAVLEQRIGRIFRHGQKSAVDVYCLVSQQGIEARIASLVGDKRALFRGLFDGTSDAVAFASSGTFVSRIQALVEPAKASPGSLEENEDSDAVEELVDSLPPTPDPQVTTRPYQERAAPAPAAAAWAGPPTNFQELFSQIEFRPGPNGKVTVEASPEVVASMASLFEGMARMFSAASGRGP